MRVLAACTLLTYFISDPRPCIVVINFVSVTEAHSSSWIRSDKGPTELIWSLTRAMGAADWVQHCYCVCLGLFFYIIGIMCWLSKGPFSRNSFMTKKKKKAPSHFHLHFSGLANMNTSWLLFKLVATLMTCCVSHITQGHWPDITLPQVRRSVL